MNQKKFCKTNDPNDLEHPAYLKSIQHDISIPFIKMKDFYKTFLDNLKLDWKLEWVSIMTYDTNYDYLLNKDLKLESSHIFDYDWFKEQNTYILTFTIRKFLTIYAYTTEYFRVINKILRGEDWQKDFMELLTKDQTLFFAFFYQTVDLIRNLFDLNLDSKDYICLNVNIKDITPILKTKGHSSEVYTLLLSILPKIKDCSTFWSHVIRMYIDELNSIIKNAPLTRKEFIVWRGVKDDSFINDINEKNIFSSSNILSCTLDISIHETFRNDDCCLKCITVPENSKCLFIGSCSRLLTEYEILFAPNANFIVNTPIQKTITYRPYSDMNLTDPRNLLCNIKTHKVKITKMRFIGYFSVL